MSDYVQVQQNDSESVHTDLEYALEGKVDSIDQHQTTCQYCQLQEHKLKKRSLAVYILLALCLFLSISFVYVQFREPTEQEVKRKDRDCARRLSSYTPALEAIEYYEMDFEYSMRQFSGPPTDEREKAWDDIFVLGHRESILVEAWAMPMLNRTNLEQFEKASPEQGDGYLALFEFHGQLGCLNLIRQYTWFLAGGYSKDRIPDNLSRWTSEENRMHVDYCIDNLRQALMCHGDVTPMLVTNDRNKDSGSKLDLNTHHKCRNFTKLQEWLQGHGIQSEAEQEE